MRRYDGHLWYSYHKSFLCRIRGVYEPHARSESFLHVCSWGSLHRLPITDHSLRQFARTGCTASRGNSYWVDLHCVKFS